MSTQPFSSNKMQGALMRAMLCAGSLAILLAAMASRRSKPDLSRALRDASILTAPEPISGSVLRTRLIVAGAYLGKLALGILLARHFMRAHARSGD